MTKRDDSAAKFSKIMAREPRTAQRSTQATVRATPVRITTDLGPQVYAALKQYGEEAAEIVGRARVPHSEIIRALIHQLQDDPDLRATITSTLRK